MSLTQKFSFFKKWLHSNSKNWEKDSKLWLPAECKSWGFFCLLNLDLCEGQMTLKQIRCISTESCEGRCGSFNSQSKCQCDSVCVYYGSCCRDIDTVCNKKSRCRSRNVLYFCINHHKCEIRSFFFMRHNRLPQFPVATLSMSSRRLQKRRLLRPRQLWHQVSAPLQQLALPLPLPIPLLHPTPPRAPLTRRWTPTQPPAAAVRLMPFCSWRIPRSMHSEVNIELTKDKTSWKKYWVGKEKSCPHRLMKNLLLLQRGILFRVG